MNRLLKASILSLAVAASTLVPMMSAGAQERWRRPHERAPVSRPHGLNGGEMAAVGVLGLAVGALIATASQRPDPEPLYDNPYRHPRPSPDRNYFPAAPVEGHRQPDVVYSYDAGLEPWSREWFRYCSQRYRTFDPERGTYRGFDGRDHFCQAE